MHRPQVGVALKHRPRDVGRLGNRLAHLERVWFLLGDGLQAEPDVDDIVDAAERQVLIGFRIALIGHDLAERAAGRLEHFVELRQHLQHGAAGFDAERAGR